MKISSSITNTQVNQSNQRDIKTNFTQKITKDEAKELKTQISENANAMMLKSTSIQTNILSPQEIFTKNYEDFKSFLNDIGYEGKPIAELSQDEAAELISEDGLFGVKQTSKRIANFVINGAGEMKIDFVPAGKVCFKDLKWLKRCGVVNFQRFHNKQWQSL